MRQALRCLVLLAGASASASAEPADTSILERAGCRVRTESIDPRGVATVAAECDWPVTPSAVIATLRQPDKLSAALSSLAECRRLSDGRVLQVHSVGWPLDDRQVTLEWSESSLSDGGMRVDVRRAARQEPLTEGRVAIAESEGRWEIRAARNGGTHLTYRSRYDAGGGLKPWLVRRFQKNGIAETLEELRTAVSRS